MPLAQRDPSVLMISSCSSLMNSHVVLHLGHGPGRCWGGRQRDRTLVLELLAKAHHYVLPILHSTPPSPLLPLSALFFREAKAKPPSGRKGDDAHTVHEALPFAEEHGGGLSSHRQGCQLLDQVLDQIAQGPIQPGLKKLQGSGIHSLSGQPVPAPHHSLSKKLPHDI